MVITGATAWLVFGQDKVSRDELIDYFGEKPGALTERVQNNGEDIAELRDLMAAHTKVQTELLIDFRLLLDRTTER